MSVRAKEIAIINSVALNGGDHAVLLALESALRDSLGPETRFRVYDSHASAAGAYLAGQRFRPQPSDVLGHRGRSALPPLARQMRLLLALQGSGPRGTSLQASERALIEELGECDAVVSTGGTYLLERYRLAPRIFNFEVAHALGLPLVLATQSIGRFHNPTSRLLLRSSLRRARCIMLRDQRSSDHLDELGVQGPVRAVVPDLAFGLADPARLRAAESRRWPARPRIAISVRSLERFVQGASARVLGAYAGAIGELCCRLVEAHNADLCFISSCQGIPEYGFDDSVVACQIRAWLPADVARRTEVDAEFHSPQQLIEQLAGFDAVVATRMHMAILGLVAGTPVLPLAYEEKTIDLYQSLGLPHWVSQAQTVKGPELARRFERMVQELPRVRKPLMQKVAQFRDDARPLSLLAQACAH